MMLTIAQILGAYHKPDTGQYGSCTRCKHGDTTGKWCNHEFAGASGLESHTMRTERICNDGSLQDYQPTTHPAQTALSFQ